MVELEASLGDRHGGFDDAGLVVDRRLVDPVVVVAAVAVDRLHPEVVVERLVEEWLLLVPPDQLQLLVGRGGLVVVALGQRLVVVLLVPRLPRLDSFFLFFAA